MQIAIKLSRRRTERSSLSSESVPKPGLSWKKELVCNQKKFEVLILLSIPEKHRCLKMNSHRLKYAVV